ncbi:glycosyltransferase family protein [Vibrio spartinae]|uniref:Oligosaccharide biosynthesis protein Alg14 like protein n=1 Tax=Vibrio spartinae TaxID=1918945 RepID=A0A1N6M4D8_9VIBR|nr:hypothetical protein [Vibrio spartinae]QMV13415.1 Oligosaccharide biosynthesis protein Alg14 like protein [Vibrio spartinae]SIO94294.1 Oligosaccharide biosynthesis protein Alg14 like protein [Vibrio spartinae]
MKNKILLVASPGGHFVQLSLLSEKLDCCERIVAGTYDKQPGFMAGERYYQISDFSRDTAYLAIKVVFQCLKILKKERPSLVVTTGAAPGLVMALLSKMSGIKTVWVDSIANSKKLSLSGRLAAKCRIHVISQWREVAESHQVTYQGRVI